ncbi:MAG: delta-60 repeat domain-containing protein, partial [Candidatus Binatia bacterium]
MAAALVTPSFANQTVQHLDPTFGSLRLAEATVGRPRDILRQSDGKIVAAGFVGSHLTTRNYLIARYESDGALDGSFGDGGMVTTSLSESQDQIWDLVLLLEGRLVAAGGYYPTPQTIGFGMVRYLTDGALDPSFGEVSQ